MAFVVLFSTMSFTVDKHYCGDILVETAILQKPEGCGMNMDNPSTSDCSITKKNCCTDEQLVFEGQDELKIAFEKLAFEKQIFIAAYFYSYINLFETVEENNSSSYFHPPPEIVKSIYKLDEVYLI